MSEGWTEVVTTLWSVANEIMNDVPAAILSEGGAVVLEIDLQSKRFNVNFVFKELSKEDVEEYHRALADGKALIFYYAPNADSDEDDEELEIKSIVLKGKNVDLKGAIEEINAHIKRTGGISLTLRELLEGDSS